MPDRIAEKAETEKVGRQKSVALDRKDLLENRLVT